MSVNLLVGHDIVALVQIEYFGMMALIRYWGKLPVISTDKAIVRVKEVIVNGVKPPFSYRHSSDPTTSWERNRVTL